MPVSFTGSQLRVALAVEAFADKNPINIDTTSVGSTTTAVISDLAFGTSGATTNLFRDVYLYIASLVSSGPAIGEISKVISTGGFAQATGTFTVAPAYSAAVQDATDLLFYYGEHPSLHWNSIQRVLRNMRYPAYLPITLITDGDMEDSGVTNWAQVTGGTIAKSATTSSGLTFGRQVLHVSAAGDQEGATSNAVSIDENETLYVAVPIDLVSGSADVILYDTTNATALKTVNVTEFNPSIVYFQQSPSSTTANVTIRLLGSEASSEFYAGPVFMWSDDRSRYPVDTSSLERGRDIKGAFTLRRGQSVEDDVYQIGELRETTVGVERDDRANLVSVVIPHSSYPTFIQGDRRYPELSSDTDTTFAERDMVVAGAMYHISRARAAGLMSKNPPLAGFHNSRARDYARTYSRMLEGTGISLVEVLDQSGQRQAVRFA